jgi:predicted TIM-barrel fold metal-dependent hydrolase
MYIDVHTHAFPEKVASVGIPKMAKISGYLPLTDGTAEDLSKKMDEWGIDRYIVQNIATKPGQMRKVNDYALSVLDEKTYAFGSVHPFDPGALQELDYVKASSLLGIKLHPDYQDFFADDEAVFPIYEKCEKLSMIILFHAGYDPLSPQIIHTMPQMLRRIALDFPRLTIIGAHLGGMYRFDEVERYLVGLPNVYLDTALMVDNIIDEEQYRRIIAHHGADHVLLGSDCPWSNPLTEISTLRKLGFAEADLDLIFSENANRLFGIT